MSIKPNGVILAIVSILFCIVAIVTATNAECEEYIPTGATEVQSLYEVAETQATELAAMPEEDVEAWHRFNEVYRESCPLCALDQLELFNACEEFNVDYFLMLGLIEKETQFRNVTGDSGESEGYCQIQKKWWSSLMDEIGAKDLTVPKDNFRTACAIISYLFDEYGCGNLTDVLTAYNSGHGGESKYADDVIANQERWANGN